VELLHAPTGISPFNRGLLIYVDDRNFDEIGIESVTDGVSNTLVISENHDLDAPIGCWASGLNCISHDLGRINATMEGIRSRHPGGANAVTLAAETVFLSNHISENVLAAVLTRNGGDDAIQDNWR
jgi:hypothetical protein